jgi:hypothetical protein
MRDDWGLGPIDRDRIQQDFESHAQEPKLPYGILLTPEELTKLSPSKWSRFVEVIKYAGFFALALPAMYTVLTLFIPLFDIIKAVIEAYAGHWLPLQYFGAIYGFLAIVGFLLGIDVWFQDMKQSGRL